MQKQRSTINPFMALSALLVTLALAPSAFAQNQPNAQAPPAPQLYSVSAVRINSEMNNEYQEFRKTERLPALKKGGIKQQGVWTTASFGEGGEYLIVTPIENLAQYDSPGPIIKALGQEAARAHNAKLARFIANSRTSMIVLRPDLGMAPKPDYAFKLALGLTVNVTPGRGAEYEKSLKEAAALGPKTNTKGVFVSKVILGGDPNQYNVFVLFDSFDDMDKFFVAFGKAAAEAKLAPTPTGVVAHTEWVVYRYRPELSIQQSAQKDASK